MASLNKVMLIGNLTRDPEVRYTPKGTAVTEIGLAVNRVIPGGEGGDRREEPRSSMSRFGAKPQSWPGNI